MISISMGDRLETPRAAATNFHFHQTPVLGVTSQLLIPPPPAYVCELYLYIVIAVKLNCIVFTVSNILQ